MSLLSPDPEMQRLSILRSLMVLDGAEERAFEDATQIGLAISGGEVCLLTFHGSERFWYALSDPSHFPETTLAKVENIQSMYGGKALIVEDASSDLRFAKNPLARDFSFYAGVPLYAAQEAVGTLAIYARGGKLLSGSQIGALEALARQVSANLDSCLEHHAQVQKQDALRLELDSARGMVSMVDYARQRFENLFNGLPIACCTIDLDGHVMEWNANSETVFGYSAPEVMYQDIFEILKPGGSKAARKRVMATIWTGEVTPDFEETFKRKEGGNVCVLCSSLPINDPTGNIVGAIWSSVDITRRKEIEAQLAEHSRVIEDQRNALAVVNGQLETLSRTDALTSLFNRRAGFEFLETEFARSCSLANPEGETETSVILLDLDKFKSINDEFGHPEGDLVLKQAALILKGSARPEDFVTRYGGEEFLVILPKTSLEDAAKVAESFRVAIADAVWSKRPVTASFGVSSSLTAETVEALVGSADEALYEAKRNGRNQVVASSQTWPPNLGSVDV